MKRLLLAGAGHAHAEVLRRWAARPVPGVEVVVLSPQAFAPYSGMVPGWLAGHYRVDEIGIDFARLCAASGARWVEGEVDAVEFAATSPDAVVPADGVAGRVHLAGGGEPMAFTQLSLNVGSTLRPPPLPAGAVLLALRPLARLQATCERLFAAWADPAASAPVRVTAVGGGAAGFESVLAVRERLRALRPDRAVSARLLSRGGELLPGIAGGARRAAERALARAGVALRLGHDFDPAADCAAGDWVLWAAGAQAHAWQLDAARRGGLAAGRDGFIRVDDALRSVSHGHCVHAVGDCAEPARPLPKAGVYAVRMGPVLAANLRAAFVAAAPRAYRPQHRFLALLSTADGRAIASRGPFAAEGRWVWRWKDRIDRAFLARYAAGAAGAADAGRAGARAGSG